jgi:hypothetical protein
MKKILPAFLILCLLAIFTCSTETGVTNQQNTSRSGVQFQNLKIVDALAKAETENKIVLIDFFSPT